MYAIVLRYKVPVSEVDKHAEAHLGWLRIQYEIGHFLLSGQQRPRVGGFILAKAMPRTALDSILADDPYTKAGVADYEAIEFAAKFAGPQLTSLIETP